MHHRRNSPNEIRVTVDSVTRKERRNDVFVLQEEIVPRPIPNPHPCSTCNLKPSVPEASLMMHLSGQQNVRAASDRGPSSNQAVNVNFYSPASAERVCSSPKCSVTSPVPGSQFQRANMEESWKGSHTSPSPIEKRILHSSEESPKSFSFEINSAVEAAARSTTDVMAKENPNSSWRRSRGFREDKSKNPVEDEDFKTGKSDESSFRNFQLQQQEEQMENIQQELQKLLSACSSPDVELDSSRSSILDSCAIERTPSDHRDRLEICQRDVGGRMTSPPQCGRHCKCGGTEEETISDPSFSSISLNLEDSVQESEGVELRSFDFSLCDGDASGARNLCFNHSSSSNCSTCNNLYARDAGMSTYHPEVKNLSIDSRHYMKRYRLLRH